jgi:O-antigen biosynthesis protein
MSADRPVATVFTSSAHPRFLDECLQSLLGQSVDDWQWIVVLHQGARWRPAVEDPRIHLVVEGDQMGSGAAKRVACEAALGEVLVELDDTDRLSSDALGAILAAFAEHPEAGFIYSDHAQVVDAPAATRPQPDPAEGWAVYDALVDGRRVVAIKSFEPTPHNVSTVSYAPAHVRAFRRAAYERVGGYDASLSAYEGDDLACRLYQHAAFHHLPGCLYLARPPADPTRGANPTTIELYDRHVQPNALAWAARHGLLALDLGAAHNKPPGYLGVDQYAGEGVDIVGDVTTGIDLPDSSVGVIRAVDFLEHVPDKVSMFNELYRLLAHGGMLLSLTPSTDGRGAFQDPTHVAPYNENSFWYFTDQEYARYVPSISCRFQVSRLVTFFPNAWHEEHQIPYVCANLIAVKDGPRQGGQLRV